MPISSLPGGMATPVEPCPRVAPRVVAAVPAEAQQASHGTPLGRIDVAVASSCGSQHACNEDAHSALSGAGLLFVVADGVGGGAMAQLASRELVAHLHDALDACRPDAALVDRAVLDADRAIARRIAERTERPGAATVVLCAPVNAFASKWLVAWVGDCRAYRLTMAGEPRIEPLTRDDTFRHLHEAPPSGGSPDDPARMVGNGATTGASAAVHDLPTGDLLALCSDGVHKHLGAGDWRRVLMQRVSLVQRCEDLVAVARANGSADDATVLLVQRVGVAIPGAAWARFARPSGGPGSAP